MAKIHKLEIRNFRGIEEFSHNFNKDFNCLVGRGDVGKTTILDAISYVLSHRWNITFYDSDFFNGEVDNPIKIETSLVDIPEKLISEDKYGLYIRGLDKDGNIQDELQDDHEKVLTIKLEVMKDLEPQWYIVNNRQEPYRISAYDRARFKVFMISDYLDNHFSWNKGNPLYTLLKTNQLSDDDNNIIIEAIRGAKEEIDAYKFEKLEDVTDKIKEISSDFGVDLSSIKTTIDFRDISIKEGKVCLHDGVVPFRLKGKGIKRLISIAIQTALSQQGGIILIDEIEQGLEPDRVRNLVRSLKKEILGQIFIATHSSEVICELEVNNLLIVNNNVGEVEVSNPDSNFQDIVRACPEAMFAKKVIVCEGKTEIGICRALDKFRKENGKEYMSFRDCVYILGEGRNFTLRAVKLKRLNLDVCVFCDSYDYDLNPTKDDLGDLDIKIFDCNNDYAIEQQVFKDLPWDGVIELIDYVIERSGKTEEQIKNSIKSKYSGTFPEDFREENTPEIRQAIAKASTVEGSEWFKRIGHGESLGLMIFKYFNEIEDTGLKKQLENLSAWIDE
jgi:putative ATP-dependent endonuclease of OLD family